MWRSVVLLAAGHIISVAALETQECVFTNDCYSLPQCLGVQDASCVCRFGSCLVNKTPAVKGTECESHLDCPCKSNPDSCFCKEGTCKEEKWECHESLDCQKLAKCNGKNCTCTYDDLCEHDCDTDEDCFAGSFGCNDPEYPGYTCQCQSHLCQFVELPPPPPQCQQITDCVTLGICDADRPCACTIGQCTSPYFVTSDWYEYYPDRNCKNEQDCETTILSCSSGGCPCEDIIPVSEDEQWGICNTSATNTTKT